MSEVCAESRNNRVMTAYNFCCKLQSQIKQQNMTSLFGNFWPVVGTLPLAKKPKHSNRDYRLFCTGRRKTDHVMSRITHVTIWSL